MNDSHKKSSPFGRRVVIAIAIGLVVLPLAWTWVPSEVARWYVTAAEENKLDQDYQAALANVDEALAWNPTRAEIYAYRAELNLELGRLDEALADAEKSLQLAPNNLPGLLQRLLVNQRRGEHAAALEDADQIVENAADSSSRRAGRSWAMSYHAALNLRAYARALAEVEIDEGLNDIEKALEHAGQPNHAYLDTRGYLRYLAGDYELARMDMEEAVRLLETAWEGFQAEMPEADPREWKQLEQSLQEDRAVLYHHRGLVYQALGMDAKAQADLTRADRLGYSPEDGVW